MYRFLLIKRTIEDIILLTFVGIGRLVALINPLKKEYKVYFFFPFYHIGGAEKVHAQIAQAAGSNSIIFFTRKSHNDGFLQEFKKSGCDIKDISKLTDNKWLYFLNFIYRGIITGYINNQKTIPVIFNGQCNFGYKISPWVNKKIRQIELIHSFNSFSYIRTPFLPFISKTIMISRKRIEEHYQYYKKIKVPDPFAEKIIHIPNAASLPTSLSSKDYNKFTVLYVGRGGLEKRVHLVTAIAKQIHEKDKSVQIEIMGDVSNIINYADFPFIKFHGNISDEETMDKIYSSANLLLLTSETEGFPLAVIEAMGHGCIIAATPVGDIPLHIKEGLNGHLFSSVLYEEKIITEGVGFILGAKNNPAYCQTVSATNFEYAKQHFSIQKFNEAYQNIILNNK